MERPTRSLTQPRKGYLKKIIDKQQEAKQAERSKLSDCLAFKICIQLERGLIMVI